MTVIRGYGPVDAVCPFCGESWMAVEDDGQLELLVRCWCGATARTSLIRLLLVPEDDS